jgi:sigma-B regulation protein RsbU (phosphoserine phosphatase)
MKDEAGRVTHFVSVLKDITEQRKQRKQEFYLQLASEVQQHLYRGSDSAAGFDMAGITCPADLTGGDYFDTIAHPDGRVTVAIGDVSGHGVGSALVMAATRAYVRAFTRSETDAASLLRNLNGALSADLNGGRFVTLMLIQVDPRTRSIEYAGAGHLPAYLLRGDGGVKLVMGSTGPPLGLLADAEFATCGPIAYGDGDTIVLFTDGITEAENAGGQEFGVERALDIVRLRRQSSARELVEGLAEAVRAFCGEERQRDDITALVCKLGAPA